MAVGCGCRVWGDMSTPCQLKIRGGVTVIVLCLRCEILSYHVIFTLENVSSVWLFV